MADIRLFTIDDYDKVYAMWQITTKRALSESDSRENIEFTKELFKAADISISDIDYSYRKIDELPPDVPRIMINNEPILPAVGIRQEVNTEHTVTDEDGNVKKYKLSLQEE